MAETKIPLKIYKGQTNAETFYNILPEYNVSRELTQVTPEEEGQAIAWFQNKAKTANNAGEYQTSLDRYLSGKTPYVLNDKGILATQEEVAAQKAQQEALTSGKDVNFGTSQAPLTVPKGTPTPQQSNAAFQASQPKPTYQETPRAAQYPGEAIDISKKYQQAAEAAKASGATSPSDYTGANDMFKQFLPSQQGVSGIDNFISQDPYLNTVISDYQNYMSQQNQRTSLVQEYQNLLKSSGIQGIDTELINMKNVIEGSEDDIRTEITKAGGLGTESQVLALTNARNKQLIKNYNTLLETRNAKEKYLDTMLNLTQQDRQAADQRFETQMNFGFKIAEINQTMKKNAIDTIDRVAKTMGWDGVYQATGGNPQLIAQIEKTYGMPSGSLAIAAQRQAQERMIAEQERKLGMQEKISRIRESELGSQYKEQQLRFGEEDRPFELQEKQLGIQLKQQQIAGMPIERQLKLEQIKTEQAQRAKTIAETNKIIKEQKGSILDPTTPEGVKQLAIMRSQVDQVGSILNSKSLNNAVGTNILSRTPETKEGFLGGIGDFLVGGGIRRLLNPGISNFVGDVEQLRSQLNLQSLIDAKSKGATFGALSDQELQVLSNSATKIGVWTVKDANGNVVGYNAKESDFKKEIDKINNFAKLDYIYRGGKPEDVGVQVIGGKYYTKNSDGSITEL